MWSTILLSAWVSMALRLGSLGRGQGQSYVGDVASDLLWSSVALPPDGLVLHGHHSAPVGSPHPGPIYIWVLALGQRIGPLFGVSSTMGATWMYTLALVGVFAVAGAVASYATRRIWAGLWFIVLLFMLAQADVLQMYAPMFALGLLAVMGAASVAVAVRQPTAPALLAVAAAACAQVYLETMILGVVGMFVALVAARGATRMVRWATAIPVSITVLIGVARLAIEGWVPIRRYWQMGVSPVAVPELRVPMLDAISFGSTAWTTVVLATCALGLSVAAAIIRRNGWMLAAWIVPVGLLYHLLRTLFMLESGQGQILYVAAPLFALIIVASLQQLAPKGRWNTDTGAVLRIVAALAVSVAAISSAVPDWSTTRAFVGTYLQDPRTLDINMFGLRRGAAFSSEELGYARRSPLAFVAFVADPDEVRRTLNEAAIPALVWLADNDVDACVQWPDEGGRVGRVPPEYKCDGLDGRQVVSVVRTDAAADVAAASGGRVVPVQGMREYALVWPHVG